MAEVKLFRQSIAMFAKSEEIAGPISAPTGTAAYLAALMVGTVLLTDAVQMPRLLSLNNVAFGDGGFDLTVQALIDRGYRAGIDFGYPYGALALAYSKLWVSWIGFNPRAFFAGVVASDVLYALGLAAFLSRIRAGKCAVALGLLGAIIGVMEPVTLAHGMERACLCWALAEQVAGRRAFSLGLATIAALIKPSMGFVYGGLLVALLILDLWRESDHSARRMAREFGPAALSGGFLAGCASVINGPSVVIRLLLPVAGLKAYRANGFGLFGLSGQTFWYFPGVHLAYYVGTPIAFWFAATAYLLIGAALALRRLHDAFPASIGAIDETLISCAFMHLAFVALFFGSNASWTNYAYMLAMGAAMISDWPGRFRTFGWGLVFLGTIGLRTVAEGDIKAWTETAPSSITANLWAPAAERNEWQKVIGLVPHAKEMVLSEDGAAQVLFEQMKQPAVASLMRGQTTQDELQRDLQELSRAGAVIVPEVPSSNQFLALWPELQRALDGWSREYQGRFFTAFNRAPQD